MDSTINPGRCKQMPLSNKWGEELIRKLDQGEPLDELFPYVKRVVYKRVGD